MKKYIIAIFCCLLLLHSLNSFAQNLDTLKKEENKVFKKTLWLGTNITMPFWTLAYGGYGFEVNSLYFVSNYIGFNLGIGVTNYRGLGLKTAANYSSLGQHIRAGILLGASDFTLYHSGITNETVKIGFLFGLSLVYANTHETGYWDNSRSAAISSSSQSISNATYWGGGYPFDEWRQVYGIEYSTQLLFSVATRHVISFKPYLSMCYYDNKSYFPVSSASGFGYLPFSNENWGSFTMGMQLWYYVRL